jgi:hypothetical protein
MSDVIDRLRTYLEGTDRGYAKLTACCAAIGADRATFRHIVSTCPEFIITKPRGVYFVKLANKQTEAQKRRDNWGFGR